MTKAHLVKMIRMRDHEIAGLKRRVKAYEEADTIDQFKAAINRAREAEELLAQARKRDTMLDDMCNLIDERDILLAEKALLESERDALKAHAQRCLRHPDWGVISCLPCIKERDERDTLRTQNALLVEALKELLLASPNHLECGDMNHPKRSDWHEYDEPCKPLNRYLMAMAKASEILAAVKEADNQQKN